MSITTQQLVRTLERLTSRVNYYKDVTFLHFGDWTISYEKPYNKVTLKKERMSPKFLSPSSIESIEFNEDEVRLMGPDGEFILSLPRR